MPSFYDRFSEIAGRFGSRTAIQVQHPDRVDSFTYAELRDAAESVAAGLHARGVKLGDRCAILADNSFRWVAAYLGVLRLGAIAEDLGGNFSRSVAVETSTGRIVLSSPGRGEWEI